MTIETTVAEIMKQTSFSKDLVERAFNKPPIYGKKTTAAKRSLRTSV